MIKVVTAKDATGKTRGGESGTVVLQDDLRATYQGGRCTNDDALTTRAKERAVDFFRQRREFISEPDARWYSGLRTDFQPGEMVQSVAWEDVGHGMMTVVARVPKADPTADWPGQEHHPWRLSETVRIRGQDDEDAGFGSGSGYVDQSGFGSFSGSAPVYANAEVVRLNADRGDWDVLFPCWLEGLGRCRPATSSPPSSGPLQRPPGVRRRGRGRRQLAVVLTAKDYASEAPWILYSASRVTRHPDRPGGREAAAGSSTTSATRSRSKSTTRTTTRCPSDSGVRSGSGGGKRFPKSASSGSRGPGGTFSSTISRLSIRRNQRQPDGSAVFPGVVTEWLQIEEELAA